MRESTIAPTPNPYPLPLLPARMSPPLNHVPVNLHRLLARLGLTIAQAVERTGVDERTIRGILSGKKKPHARSLYKLAEGLDVPVDELFQNPGLLAYRTFDRATNPVVDEVIQSHPQLFTDWTQADFDELYSRFGTGGALTHAGAIAAAEQMNHKQELLRKAALVLESHEAELLGEMIEMLFRRIQP